jgi:hypothetical protein
MHRISHGMFRQISGFSQRIVPNPRITQPARVLHVGFEPLIEAIAAGVVIVPPLLRLCDVLKNGYYRTLVFDDMVKPLEKKEPVSPLMPMSEQLHRIRSLFSEPSRVAAFHHIIQHMDPSCKGKPPEAWVGANHCAKVSVLAAVILRSQGFHASIHGIVGVRPECVGIDHAWVEVPVLAGSGDTAIVVDLTCRQYTGAFRGDDVEVPHGAIAPKSTFLAWVGPSAENWKNAVDFSNSDMFKPSIQSFEKALYRNMRMGTVTIYTPLVGAEDFLYGASLFLLTRELLRNL